MGPEADANRNFLNKQLFEIRELLGEHTGKLDGINQNVEKTRQDIGELWRSQSAQDKQIAHLETKAGVFGAVAGIVVAVIIGIGRWLLGK